MDASTVLWEHWRAQVKALLPGIHGHQKNALAFLVIGMVVSGSAVLQRVAESLSLQGINPAKMTSIERRLARFLSNDRVVVTKIWELFLAQVLPFWQGKTMRFVLDCTPFRADATIVSVGLLVHSRVATSGLGGDASARKMGRATMEHCGTSARSNHCAFGGGRLHLDRRSRAGRFPIGEDLPGSPLALPLTCEQGAHQGTRKMGQGWSAWSRFETFVSKPGQQWYGWAKVWKEDTIETYVSACWMPGYEEGWILISESFSRETAGPGVRLAHACRINVPRQQKSRMEPGSQLD